MQPEDTLTTSSTPERGLGGIAGFPLLGAALGPQPPGRAPWRLCFTFVAQQLLVSANILIMFDCVRSEAEVAPWFTSCPLSMLRWVSKLCSPTWSVSLASPAAAGASRHRCDGGHITLVRSYAWCLDMQSRAALASTVPSGFGVIPEPATNLRYASRRKALVLFTQRVRLGTTSVPRQFNGGPYER